jgi:hypothetical protein
MIKGKPNENPCCQPVRVGGEPDGNGFVFITGSCMFLPSRGILWVPFL